MQSISSIAERFTTRKILLAKWRLTRRGEWGVGWMGGPLWSPAYLVLEFANNIPQRGETHVKGCVFYDNEATIAGRLPQD